MAEQDDDNSSGSDMFAADIHPVSMFSKLRTTNVSQTLDSESDDDDDISFDSSTKKRNKRGKGTKRLHQDDSNCIIQKNNSTSPKKSKRSVFDNPSDDDDEIQEVLCVDPPISTKDRIDIQAEQTQRLAQAVLANDVSEAQIEEEVKFEMDIMKQSRVGLQNTSKRASAPTNQGNPIVLKIQSESHSTKMRIKTTDPIIKMLDRFCQLHDLDRNSAVIQVDGENVLPTETPKELELEEGMVVDVVFRKS